MARLTTKKAQKVLDAAAAWKKSCLEADLSAFDQTPVWTLANLQALESAYLGHLIDDPSRRFYDKLDEQLAAASPQVVRLAAELLWVMLLFPSKIEGQRKREDILHVWNRGGMPAPVDHPFLTATLDGGIGHTGIAYNTLRWKELAYAIQAFRAFKQLPVAERHRLLADAWQFTEWLDALPEGRNRTFRNLLIYLLFPESFEPMAILRHKRLAVHHFAADAGLQSRSLPELRGMPPIELDRQLLQIRRHLERKYPGQTISFYGPPVTDEFDIRVRGPKKPRVIAPKSIDRHDAATVEPVIQLVDQEPSVQALVTQLLADAMEHAHSTRPSSWAVSLRRHSIRFNVGRLLVLELRRGGIRLTVLEEMLPPDVSIELRERVRNGEVFATISGARLVTLKASELGESLPLFRPSFFKLIERAAATSRKPIGQQAHSPAVIDHLESRLGRKLPRPTHQVVGSSASLALPEAVPVTTPLASFRATELDLAALVSDVEIGDIGLPDIQRPFVWTATKVRDLFDSMYRGYPVGYLLFWQTGAQQQGVRTIGVNDKAFPSPRRLIVDGQQRLTSLFAVMRGHEVLADDYSPIRLEIAFRPRDGRFEVADAAIRRDPEFIADISKLLSDDRGSYTLIHEFLHNLGSKRTLSDRDREVIGLNLDRLFGLKRYRFSVIEISADLQEEAVADIFVRINSEGVKLRQGDFILTLLSVIWDDGRRQLEEFSRRAMQPPARSAPSPFNHLIKPSPDQMLRVGIAVGFRRARLRAVYQLLRGKDPDTGDIVAERREESLERLRSAQVQVLNLDNWHQFLACITAAGYRLEEQISSQNGLLQAYALYLLGKALPGMDAARLNRLIGRWYAMTNISGRYSASPETVMEQDLSRIAAASDASEFERELNRAIEGVLTPDYWSISLPLQLETSSIRSPGWSAYIAAQLRLNSQVLFSDKPLWSILDPLTRGHRRAFEVHHLFPKAWLIGRGVGDRKQTNQIANYALLEWPDNNKAGARAPMEYVPDLKRGMGESVWARMCELHALPKNWASMDYGEFLQQRRKLMASIIRRGFESL